MPPRVRIRPRRPHPLSALCHGEHSTPTSRRYASLSAAAVSPAPSTDELSPVVPIQRYPPTQPPSLKRPEFRKTQLLRQYLSLVESSPMMLVFQHNNLTANEMMGLRRELAAALRSVDEAEGSALAHRIRPTIVQTGILAAALRIIESGFLRQRQQDQRQQEQAPSAEQLTHALSAAAHAHAQRTLRRRDVSLAPLLSGPLMLLTAPAVSPAHLRAVLSLLAPSPQIPAPRRRANPGYHEPAVQSAVQKLMLLAAKVEGRLFDFERVRDVAMIEGGLDGLRASLVRVLGGVAAGLVGALDAQGRLLYGALEGRRVMMEEEEKEGKGKEAS